ncbi:RHS repeat-associated core domain-containing protein [Micromonospora sp. CA-263727]|uniref:RHS repeat-associated core domain-containing protein n=1 Tax=Micromonospora sp. CA-263727 TaxID=3239967 RepID=UPI003D8B0DCC
MRTVTGLAWSGGDHQGTEQVQINADNLTTSRKRRLPNGEDRSATQPAFFGTRGFVGGTQDDTGLTHLGAREYDPTLGRFISVDPIQDLADPQQWNGYSYANNNPVTLSDPSGQYPIGDELGNLRSYPTTGGKHKVVDHRPKAKSIDTAPEEKCKRRCGKPEPSPDEKTLDRLADALKDEHAAEHDWLMMLLFGPTHGDRVSCGAGASQDDCSRGIWRIEACERFDLCSESYLANLRYHCGCSMERYEINSMVVPVGPPGAARPAGPLSTQKIGPTQPLTNKQATDLAAYNGYQPTKQILRGERIFTNGKHYIVQYTTSHIGGMWKIARSPSALNSKSTRTATTDALLTPIGG